MAEVIQTELFGICFACPDETNECNPITCDKYYRWAVTTMSKEKPQESKRKRSRKCKTS